MAGESTSEDRPGPAKKDPRPDVLPSTEGARPPGADLTIDFQRDETEPVSGALASSPGLLPEYAFLEPPRNDDELGWLAHYRVRRRIGSGGMGLVFLAEDTQLLRPVALKVIRPELAASSEAAARFAREARSAAAIKHDHVVTIYQVGEARGVAYLAMEYLQGLSLERWLDRGRKPSIDLILRIGREVASGLSAAHRLGLVHRDIKPANIWLEAPNGRVKILDFGQARAEREDVQITRFGAIMGTPAFMSPEQAAGELVSSSSDLFSLGCVLYVLCCGQRPFQGKTILTVLNALASLTPSPPRALRSEIPEGLSSLVMLLLEKSPEDRPGSAQEVFDTIRTLERQLLERRQQAAPVMGTIPVGTSSELARGNSVVEPTAAGSAKPWFMDRRRVRPVMLAATATIAVVMASAVWFSRHPRFQKDLRPRFPLESKSFRGTPDLGSKVSPVTAVESAAPAVEELSKPLVTPPPTEVRATGPGASVAVAPPIPPAIGPAMKLDQPQPAEPTPKRPPPIKHPAPRTLEPTWGTFIDPDGDCRLLLDEARHIATFQVPGKPHLLSAERGRLNAPRTLRPVSGDFQVLAHVLIKELVGGRATTTDYSPYHGAGILLWQDQGNYVRLEIATDIPNPRGKPVHYANFQYRQGSRLVSTLGPPSDSGSAYLRLVRKGDEIIASFGPDGVKWVSVPGLRVNLAVDIEVGLVAINSSTKPLIANVEEYQVTIFPKKEGDPGP
jgi:serine/threonine protein kinase